MLNNINVYILDIISIKLKHRIKLHDKMDFLYIYLYTIDNSIDKRRYFNNNKFIHIKNLTSILRSLFYTIGVLL